VRLEIEPPSRIASPARTGLGEKLPLAARAVDGDFFGLFEAAGKVAVPGDVGLVLERAHCCFSLRSGVSVLERGSEVLGAEGSQLGIARGCGHSRVAELRDQVERRLVEVDDGRFGASGPGPEVE